MSYQSSRGNGDTAKHVFVFIMPLSADPQNIKTHGLNVLTPEHLFARFKQLIPTSSSVSQNHELMCPVTHPGSAGTGSLHGLSCARSAAATQRICRHRGWCRCLCSLVLAAARSQHHIPAPMARWWAGRGLSLCTGAMDRSDHPAALAHRSAVLL